MKNANSISNEELVKEIIEFSKVCNNLLSEYDKLLREKRQLKAKGKKINVGKIPISEVNSFRDLHFAGMTAGQAKTLVEKASTAEKLAIHHYITRMKEDYLVRLFNSTVAKYRDEIRAVTVPKSSLAMDPDRVRCGGKRWAQRPASDTKSSGSD